MFDFETVIKNLGLGNLTAQPRRVTGGYLHKMFKLETTTGKYAVKLLNPVIMKRPGVLENYKRAECIEQILSEYNILIVPALEIHDARMQRLDGQYFYLFEWTDAKAFELAKALAENQELLYQAQQEYNEAIDKVPDIVCITDGDMDCKNVLWKNGQPFIIDLECLDYGNPFLEMFQLALSWAGDAVCDIDFGRLGNFLRAYRSEYGEVDADWKTLSGAGFSWLDWLEYNTKRALLIECGDEEEQKLGIREAEATIRRIVYYHTVREDISNSLT